MISRPSFDGTVKRGNAVCPCCGYTTPVKSVREQLKKRHGGANDARLLCVVTTRPGQQGRFYRLPIQADIDAVKAAEKELKKRIKNHEGKLSLVPEEETPKGGGSGAGRAFSQRNYGMNLFCDLFSSRQLLALTTLSRLVRELDRNAGGTPAIRSAVQTCLALAVDKQADYLSSICRWVTCEFIASTFGRQALPIVWDFSEVFPFSDSTGCFDGVINWVAEVLEANSILESSGHVSRSSATHHPLPDSSAHGFITDPPYYDAVPYADLSDFFIVWLKRSIPKFFYQDLLTPKTDECIVDEVKGKDKAYFESTMKDAMKEGCRVLSSDGIGVVVFAHKSTAGWESQIKSMIDAGWIITGSWPIDTERPVRMRAQGSAALASSIHLVCRPRIGEPVGDWRDVIAELPKRIHAWMPRLAQEGVVGADAIFACLGPALEIFSNYSKVEKANGDVVPLREYLELVWGAISKEALTMIFQGADTTGFEEDARLTSIWLWTLGSSGELSADSGENEASEDEDEEDETITNNSPGTTFTLEYDAARKIAQGLGIHLEQLSNVVEIKGSKARLLSVEERTSYLFKKPMDKLDEVPVLSKSELQKQKKAKRYENSLLDKPDRFATDDRSEAVSVASHAGEMPAFQGGATILDRIHQCMLLFATGRSDALKRFLVDEEYGKDGKLWKLAQSLSALYPIGSNEKRWVDGVLARKKGLGF